MKLNRIHYAWRTVIISMVILAALGFTWYPFGIFLKPITEEFNWDRGALTGALAVSILVSGAIGILAGRLSDRYGPRPIVTIGGLLSGIAFLLLPLINALWHAYLILGILIGIGGVFTLIPIMSLIPRWFTKRVGIAMGITMAGLGVGGIITPPITQLLISTYDWRWACVALGLLTIIIIIPVAQFLKHSPQRAGLKPYGEGEIIEGKQSPSSSMKGFSLKQAIRTKGFWFFGLVQTFGLFYTSTVMVHIVPHASDTGIPEVSAAVILSVIAVFAVIGRLIVGFISDKIGGRKALTVCLILMILSAVWLLSAEEIWMFYVFAVIFGFANGGFTTLFSVVTAELFGLASLGAIIGGFVIFATLGEALGAPISGTIFDITGSYRVAFLLSIGTSTVAVIISVFLLRYKGKTSILNE